jgi:hypothetical protein
MNAFQVSANGIRAFTKGKQLRIHAHHHDCSTAAALFANGTFLWIHLVQSKHTSNKDLQLLTFLNMMSIQRNKGKITSAWCDTHSMTGSATVHLYLQQINTTVNKLHILALLA